MRAPAQAEARDQAFHYNQVFCVKNMFFIEIENSFDGAILLDKDSGFPITTKEDKEVHGIGLKISEIVQQTMTAAWTAS